MQKIKFQAKRAASTMACVIMCIVLLALMVFHKSAVISGVNAEMDDKKIDFINTELIKNTVEGSFYDSYGNPITVAEKAGTPADIVYDECYSHLIGYNSTIYGLSGLRSRYAEHLFDGGKDSIGAEINLTVLNTVQEFCYNLLEGTEGSCVVLNPYNGEIIALASRSHTDVDYNANQIDDYYETYNNLDSFFYNRAVTDFDPPGSTFKIVTGTAMLQNDMKNFTYKDTGAYKTQNGVYENYGNQVFGKLNLTKAMKYSANTYFCAAAEKMGGGALQRTAHDFLYGKTIDLDFCQLKSNFDLESYDNYDLLAQASFGQGRTKVSPLQLAMQIGAIQNYGKIMKPYMVNQISNDGKTVYTAPEPSILSQPCSEDNALEMYEILKTTATEYGFNSNPTVEVIAKSGTAEISNNKNSIYLTLGISVSNAKFNCDYAVCISQRNTENTSNALLKRANQLTKFLIENHPLY